MPTPYASAAALPYAQHRATSQEITASSFLILLIEDNSSDALFLKHELKKYLGDKIISVVNVSTMLAALEMIDLVPFHLAVLDLNLIDSEGSASVAALHSRVPNIPIIVLSGSGNPRLKSESLLCGAKRYLVKGEDSTETLIHAISSELSSQFL